MNQAVLLERIAELGRYNGVEGISRHPRRKRPSTAIRIVIELKRDASGDLLLNSFTVLETSGQLSASTCALNDAARPQMI